MKHIGTVVFVMLLQASFAGGQTSSSSATSPSSPAVNQSPSSGANQSASSGASQSSLGDYARKIRKDTGTKEKPKVYDNDNLPMQDKLSVVGPKPDANGAASADDKNSDNKTDAAKTADDAKKAEWKDWQQRLTTQKGEVDLASRELDVLQREYQLREAAMYGDAGNRLRNEGQWDKEDADYKQKIADKQKAVEDAKAKLTDLQEDARKAGVPANMMDSAQQAQ
jgi:hypothetical protein